MPPPRLRLGAVSAVSLRAKAVKNGYIAAWGDFKDRASGVVVSVDRGCAALQGRSVEVPAVLHQRGLRIGAVRRYPGKAVQSG